MCSSLVSVKGSFSVSLTHAETPLVGRIGFGPPQGILYSGIFCFRKSSIAGSRPFGTSTSGMAMIGPLWSTST